MLYAARGKGEKEMYTHTYTEHFKPKIIQRLLIDGKKIYPLASLARIFTRMVKKYEHQGADDFRLVSKARDLHSSVTGGYIFNLISLLFCNHFT